MDLYRAVYGMVLAAYGEVSSALAPHTLTSVYAGHIVVAAAVANVVRIVPATLIGVPSKEPGCGGCYTDQTYQGCTSSALQVQRRVKALVPASLNLRALAMRDVPHSITQGAEHVP